MQQNLRGSMRKFSGAIARAIKIVIKPNDPHMREIIQGSSVSFTMKLGGAALNFGFNTMLARMFGAEGAGVYFIALTVTTFGAMLGRVGLDNALLRFVASGVAAEDWTAVKGVYRNGLVIGLFASLIVSMVVYISAPWLATVVFGKQAVALPIRYMAAAITPFVLLTLLGELLKGLKKIFYSQLVQGFGFQLLCVLGLVTVGFKLGLNGAFLSYIVSAWLMALLGFVLWHKSSFLQIRNVAGKFNVKKLFTSAKPLFAVSALSISYNWISTLLLGVWCTKADVGIFGLAFRTSMLISFILVAVNSISAPKFAEIYGRADLTTLEATARKTVRLMIAAATPIFLIFILFPTRIMEIFGSTFSEGAITFAILSGAQYVNVVAGSVGYLLMMTGHEVQVRNSNLIAASLCVALSLILIPKYGHLGAGVSMSIALILRNLIEIHFVKKHLNIGALFFNLGQGGVSLNESNLKY